jgi:hypothetical protein
MAKDYQQNNVIAGDLSKFTDQMASSDGMIFLSQKDRLLLSEERVLSER